MKEKEPRDLRNAFGTFITGVTVVTALDAENKPIGFTANSFSSVSLDPPLISICLANTSANYDTLVHADGFAVNILSETQTEVSNTFARRVEDRFATVGWNNGPFGSPILEGVSAWFDCTVHKTVDAGDHVILIGQVQAFEANSNPALGYARGAYFTASSSAAAIAAHSDLVVSALIENDGHILMIDDGGGGMAIPEIMVGHAGATASLQTLLAAMGLKAKPGFIYSVFEDTKRKRQHISFLCQTDDDTPARGTFVPLANIAVDDVADPATATMLERLSSESRIGNYGIYFGTHHSGEVRPIRQER